MTIRGFQAGYREPQTYCQFEVDSKTPCNICFIVCTETPIYMPDPDHVCSTHRFHGCRGSLIVMADAKRVCASSTGIFSFDACTEDHCGGTLGPTDTSCPKCGTPDYVREQIRFARSNSHKNEFPFVLPTELEKSSNSVQTSHQTAVTPPPKFMLSGAQLAGVDLSGKVLSMMEALNVNFQYANLSRTDLSGSELPEADFTGANLSEAYLVAANLYGANLAGAQLTEVHGRVVYCNHANFTGANCSGSDFSYGSFESAVLHGAKLVGTKFRGADLSGADLSATDCRGADFTDASLAGANIYEADLSFTNLTSEQIASTVSLATD